MLAYVAQDIARGDNPSWIKRGYYKILRRFDENRWVILLPSNGVKSTKPVRILTLVDNTEIMLTYNSGVAIPQGA